MTDEQSKNSTEYHEFEVVRITENGAKVTTIAWCNLNSCILTLCTPDRCGTYLKCRSQSDNGVERVKQLNLTVKLKLKKI